MIVVLQVICVLLFAVLIAAYLFVRNRSSFSVVDYFMAFFVLQFGPQAIVQSSLQTFLGQAEKSVLSSYYLVLGLAYFGLAVGFVFGGMVFRYGSRSVGTPVVVWPSVRLHSLLLVAVAFYVAIFASLGGLQRIGVWFDYVSLDSMFSYTEIRRELVVGSKVYTLSAFARYTITAILFALVVGFYVGTKRFGVYTILACVALFFVCALQLNKLVYVYYLLLMAVTVHHVKVEVRGGEDVKRIFAKAAGLGTLLVVAVSGLIYMQYFEYYESATSESWAGHAAKLITYRVFFIGHDALALFCEFYPSVMPHTQFNNVQLLTRLFGLEFTDPTVDIPWHFFGTTLTSIQSGFMASSYASFGFGGVLVNGFLVGLLVTYLTRMVRTFSSPIVRGCAAALFGVNVYFLTSSQFHTALLSGGVLLIPLVFKAAQVSHKMIHGLAIGTASRL